MKPSLFIKACALTALVAVVAVGGCGRRGALSPPPSATAPADAAQGTYDEEAAAPEAKAPDNRRFILDPLL